MGTQQFGVAQSHARTEADEDYTPAPVTKEDDEEEDLGEDELVIEDGEWRDRVQDEVEYLRRCLDERQSPVEFVEQDTV
jgi:hypothetical protein